MRFGKTTTTITAVILFLSVAILAYFYVNVPSQSDRAEIAVTSSNVSNAEHGLDQEAVANDAIPSELKDIAVSLSSLKQAMKQLEQNERGQEIEKANAMIVEMDELISQAGVKQINHKDTEHTAVIEGIDNRRAKILNQETTLDEINSQK